MTQTTEFAKGFSSGLLHDMDNTLCVENVGKSETGICDTDYPLVAAYWKGYRTALVQLQII